MTASVRDPMAFDDPANWGLWTDNGVGLAGLVCIAMGAGLIFGELNHRVSFHGHFGVARKEASPDLRRSAHLYNLLLGALAGLALIVAMLGNQWPAALVFAAFAAIWIGGGYVLTHFGQHLPLLGKKLAPALTARRQQLSARGRGKQS